jgi:aspartate kinase
MSVHIQIPNGDLNGTSHPVLPAEEIRKHQTEKSLGTSSSSWVVQKFGGTALGKAAEDVTDIVKNGLLKDRLAIVCSARSSSVKSDGTTTRLLRAAKVAAGNRDGLEGAVKLCEEIQADHENAATRSIRNETLRDAFVADLRAEIESLTRTLQAVHQLEEVSVKVEDRILSLGERLSCLFMTALLEDRDVPAQLVDLSSVISDHNIPDLNQDDAYKALADALGKEVLKAEGKLPVVTGHFGFVPSGLLHSIGRGYTDLAAALGMLLLETTLGVYHANIPCSKS